MEYFCECESACVCLSENYEICQRVFQFLGILFPSVCGQNVFPNLGH